MKLSKAARRILGNLVGQADRIVADVIRDRGGGASNVREAGRWATQSLGEVAIAAACGDVGAVKAIKIVKEARRLGRKY
jgi:hypothetical protein